MGDTRAATWFLRIALIPLAPLLLLALLEALGWAFGVERLADDPGYEAWQKAQVCHYGGDPEAYCDRAPLADAQATTVVAVLGGSSVYGYPKGMKPFPQVMRTLLEEAAPGAFSVRNYGLFCKDSIFVGRCARTLIEEGETAVLVVYSGHNDFLNFMRRPGPRAMMFLEDHSWLIGLRDALARSRTYSFFVRGPAGGLASEWKRLPSPEFEEAFEVVLDAYTRNLEDIVERAADHGVEVVLITVASNLSEHPYARDDWDDGLAPGKNPPEWDAWRTHFGRGVALAREGRFADAHVSFVAARDVLPMGRAPSQLNERIRGIVARHPDVHLVDFERRIDELAQRELIGCGFFGDTSDGVAWCDPFHPSTRTHRLIAESVSEYLLTLER